MMKNLIAATILLVSTSAPATELDQSGKTAEAVEFCKLADPIARAADGRDVNQLLRSYAQSRQLVYVGGFLDQKNKAFYDNLVALRELDPKFPVTRLAPDSKVAIETNVAWLKAELAKAAQKNPGRAIVLVGMSKGAAEVVQLAVTHPEIFSAGNAHGFVVDKALSLNASIGGSYLADLELGDRDLVARWEKYKKDTKQEDSWFERVIGGWLKRQYLDSTTPGFKSLSMAVSKARNAALLAGLTEEKGRALADKILYVTTHRTGKDATDMPSYMLKLAGFLMSEGMANDGIMFEKDQLLAGVGTHLTSMVGGSHFNVTGTEGKAECRKEFTRYLLLKAATF